VAHAKELKTLKAAKETTTICPFLLRGGPGAIVHYQKDGRVINTRLTDHVINRPCAEGVFPAQLSGEQARLTRPMYRAPGAKEWKPVSWDWALENIAKRVKATRDATFMAKNAKGETVNRTEAIASVGSAALDNEECWAYQAMLRAMGLVFIEHQARI
jgi:formate dehydrogenase major subunit